jgi:radical SAM superfamily enzyme YgiQ (UPF0313 family)
MSALNQRILLIHPLGYESGIASGDISRIANLMPPLGLCSLAAYLESKSIPADIIDCFAHPNSDLKILETLKNVQPAFIGISCTTSSFPDAVRIIALCKEQLPALKAVVGGPHISAVKALCMEKESAIDFAIAGEGERALEQLIQTDGKEPESIPGLCFRNAESRVVYNGPADKIEHLDSLPFPAYEKLEGYPQIYQLPIFNYPTRPNASCISSRGCPYSCSYCDRSVFGKTFRGNSAEYLIRHIEYLKNRWGIRHINFYDDQFTLNRKRIEAFCKLMIEKKMKVTFNCAVRAEHVDPELLKLMKQAGCWMISLGIETGDPDLLKLHRSHTSLEQVAQTIRNIHKAGIRVKGLLMLGLPGETEASVKNSMQFVFSLPIDEFNLAKFTPFPGTPLYARIHELGTFDENPELMDCMHFVFVTKGMTREKLDALFLHFYKSHFMRPRVIWGYVTMLWKSPHSWGRFIRNMFSFLQFARSNQRIQAHTAEPVPQS